MHHTAARVAGTSHGGRMRSRSRYEMIDALEPRRFLTQVITATEGDDNIVVQFDNFNNQQVKINGEITVVTDPDFEVDALGGDDTINVKAISQGLISNNQVTIITGDGADKVTTGAHGAVTLAVTNPDPSDH